MSRMFGVIAAEPVKRLIGLEEDVSAKVAEFANGRGDDNVIDVVAPPSLEHQQMLRNDASRHDKMELPLIRLTMRIVNHSLYHSRVVRIDCTDDDIDKIVKWFHDMRIRKMQRLQAHDIKMMKIMGNA